MKTIFPGKHDDQVDALTQFVEWAASPLTGPSVPQSGDGAPDSAQEAIAHTANALRPARPYPEDYEQHVAQATRERDSGFEPPLAARIENIEAYDEIFLGFPIWGEIAPPPIRSFLKAHDLRGKTLRPIITHGGYGVGSSPAVLASHAPHARIEQTFVMEADQERRTLNQVREWLRTI